ncbi:MAG: exopolysaccharide transport family protein [Pseudomonadota bacterium]
MNAFDFWEFARKVCRNWLLVLLFTILGAGLFGATVSFWPDTYVASSKLIYDPAETKLISENSALSPLTRRYYKSLAEAEIIQSDAVIERVVSRLGLASNEAFLNGSAWSLFVANVEEAVTSIFPEFRGSLFEPEIVLSEQEAHQYAVGLVRNGLDIEMSKLTTIVTVTYQATQAELASQISNAVVEAYREVTRERKTSVAESAGSELQQRLDNLLPKILRMESEIVEKEKKFGIDGNGAAETAATLGKEGRRIQSELNELSELEIARSEQLARGAGTAVRATRSDENRNQGNNSLVSELRTQLTDARRKQADQIARYGPKHPWVARARSEVRSLQGQIRSVLNEDSQALKGELESIKKRRERLSARLQDIQTKLGATRSATIELEKLKREATATRQIYVSLLSRRKQADEIKQLRTDDIQIISRATLPGAASRIKPLAIGTAILLGLVGVGLLSAIAAAYFMTNLRSAEEFQFASGVPTVTVMPRVPGRGLSVSSISDSALFRSAIDRLRVFLEPRNNNSVGRIALFSSANETAGKSVTAHAVAHRAAQGGTKTLLVDFDLASKLRTPPLLERDGKKTDAVAKVDQCKDTQLMKAYYTHPSLPLDMTVMGDDSSKSILETSGAGAVERYLDSLRSRYELVIIDGPPVSSAPDAMLLTELVDDTYVVAVWNKTSNNTLRKMVKKLNSLPGKVKGVIVNQASEAYVNRFNKV